MSEGTTTPPAPEDPERMGGYRILGLLGQGGMGRVFLAEDAEGHRVALKLVHEEFTADPEFRRRFSREVEAAGKVLSFFTVPLVDSGADAETPWLATQYVPGPSLSAAVRRDGPLPVERLCSLAAALGEALIVIHAAGIVHRDLKPSNVLLADDGPRVIDFGIARAVDSEELTGTGHALGTFGYAPPEQIVAEEPVGPAGDVFALGGVLLFAATGRDPFGEGPPAVLAYRTVYEEPELDGLPEELTALVRRCLAKDPALRPTPREVIGAARAAQSRVPAGTAAVPARTAEEPTSYRIAPPALPAPAVAGSRPDPGTAAGARSRARRRYRALTAAAAVVALAVAGVVYLPDLAGEKRDTDGSTGKGPGIAPAADGADPLPDVTAKGDRRVAWTAQPGVFEVDSEVMGAWLTPKALVRVDGSGVRGFAPRTGTSEWTVPPPAKGLVPCGASDAGTATSGGVGLVRYGKAYTSPAACDVAAALDSGTGRLLWHRRVGEAPRHVASVSGDVMVVSGERGVLGLDRATGRTVWTYPWTRGDCEVDDVVPGVRTIAVSDTCDREDIDTRRVVELDIATGRTRATHEVERSGASPVEVVVAEPLVARYADPSGDVYLSILGSAGGKPLDLPVEQSFGTLRRSGTLVGRNVLVMEAQSGPGGTARGLAAIDLGTGKVRWHTAPREEVLELDPLRIQGDSLYAVEGEDTEELGDWLFTVRRRSLADGTVTETSRLPTAYQKNHPDRLLASGGLVVQVNSSDDHGLAAFDTAPDSGR
ncbi:protein kinase domain-containing protein [Streptomyces edwardsiae]|uniref:Protein kinase n=1 Tax=Streptomyces edwardsiae TaxID=3075527 RepID=A0ABU2QBU9_9ACTN|nr:protein kinase [Streptomyces sp. DSM 41635]MDT0401927.1 protein kinase [Streptomyces sp. DSM 41635]